MTLQELLTSLTRDLHAAGTDAPALEARLLAGHVLHLDRIGLMLAMPSPVADDAAGAIRALTARRCAGEPLAHITGRREFFGRDFEVSPQTLIPRPETELLLEIVLREYEGHGEVRFADLGTGTGCIGITLALELPHSRGLLLEYSAGALPVAARNIRSLQAAERLALVRGDMFTPPLLPGGLDVLVSNPPYIPDGDIAGLDVSVRDYEPMTALKGGDDGLDFYRAISDKWRTALHPGSRLYFEVGIGQADDVLRIMRAQGFGDIEVVPDTAGIPRVVYGTLHESVFDTE